MKVVTVIDNVDDPGFKLLKSSCIFNTLELEVLITNKPKQHIWRSKDELFRKYLSDKNDDEIVLFTDGTDAFFTAGEKEILTKYSGFNSDLVFSAECGCYPNKSVAGLFKHDEKTPYTYLNSGGFIGKIGYIKELLDDFCNLEKYWWSNQYFWIKRYLKHADKIKLDTYCEIFCTLFTEVGEEYYLSDIQVCHERKSKWFDESFLIENNRFYNKITKTWPCHAHFNGSSKILFDHKTIQQLTRQFQDVKR